MSLLYFIVSYLISKTTFPVHSKFGKNLCDKEIQALSNVEKPCSQFMDAVLSGYSLDRDASGFTDMTDSELQKSINLWMRDPDGSPQCAFYK